MEDTIVFLISKVFNSNNFSISLTCLVIAIPPLTITYYYVTSIFFNLRFGPTKSSNCSSFWTFSLFTPFCAPPPRPLNFFYLFKVCLLPFCSPNSRTIYHNVSLCKVL